MKKQIWVAVALCFFLSSCAASPLFTTTIYSTPDRPTDNQAGIRIEAEVSTAEETLVSSTVTLQTTLPQSLVTVKAEEDTPIYSEESLASLGYEVMFPEWIDLETGTQRLLAGDPPIGEYTFTVEDSSFSLRIADTVNDISGMTDGNGALGEVEEREKTPTELENGGYWARWFVEQTQYCLFSRDSEQMLFYAVYSALQTPN